MSMLSAFASSATRLELDWTCTVRLGGRGGLWLAVLIFLYKALCAAYLRRIFLSRKRLFAMSCRMEV